MKRRGDVEDFDAEPLETLAPAIPFTVATESKATAEVAKQTEAKTRKSHPYRTGFLIYLGVLCGAAFVPSCDASMHNNSAKNAEIARQAAAEDQTARVLPRVPEGKYAPGDSFVTCAKIDRHNMKNGDVISEIITQGLGDDPDTQPIVEGDPEFAQEVYDRNISFINGNRALESASSSTSGFKFFNDCIKIDPVFTSHRDGAEPTYLRQATYQSYANIDGDPMIGIIYRSNAAGDFIPQAIACQPHGICEDYLVERDISVLTAN